MYGNVHALHIEKMVMSLHRLFSKLFKGFTFSLYCSLDAPFHLYASFHATFDLGSNSSFVQPVDHAGI